MAGLEGLPPLGLKFSHPPDFLGVSAQKRRRTVRSSARSAAFIAVAADAAFALGAARAVAMRAVLKLAEPRLPPIIGAPSLAKVLLTRHHPEMVVAVLTLFFITRIAVLTRWSGG